MSSKMKSDRFPATLAILLLISSVRSCDDIDFTYIHDGVEYVSETATCSLENGSNLGSHRFWCLGDLDSCSNGLSIQFWFQPSSIPITDPEMVLISNGGHLTYSEGIYMTRKWNDQYRLGLSKGGNTWFVDFRLIPGYWVHLMVTWENAQGLKLYIDGFFESSDAAGLSRNYVPTEYDVNSNFEVGGWQLDGVVNHGMTFNVINITVRNAVLTETDIEDDVGDNPLLYIGCEEILILDGSNSVVMGTAATAVQDCRSHCKTSDNFIAKIDGNLRCNCSDFSQLDGVTLGVPCTTTPQCKVYAVSHLTDDDPFTVNILVEDTVGDSNINPLESVTLTLDVDPQVTVDVIWEFGDGTNLTTGQTSLSYWWLSAGSYEVTLTVIVGQLTKIAMRNVEVVEFGLPPDYVGVFPSHETSTWKIALDVLVVDVAVTTCQINWGDGGPLSPAVFNEHVESLSFPHTYPFPYGKFDISVDCVNSAGNLQGTAAAYTQTYFMTSTTFKMGYDFIIPVRGDGAFLSSLDVTVNNASVPFTPGPNRVTVGDESFPEPHGYYVTISTATGTAMVTWLLDIQGDLTQPSFTTESTSIVPWVPQNYTVNIPPGDHMHACIKYGVNGFFCIYFDILTHNFPVELSATYADAGYYPNFVQIGNALSYKKEEMIIAIEELLVSIGFQADNVTAIAQSVQVSIDLNMEVKPPLRVTFYIEYGDGSNETIEYTSSSTSDFEVFLHHHQYSDWGIYNISVTASNDLSSIQDWTLVQVGQNISDVDLTTSTERVSTGDYVTLDVTVPTGSDITYTVGMGDGTTMTIPKTAFTPTMSIAPDYAITTSLGTKTMTPMPTSVTTPGVVMYSTPDNITTMQLKSDSTLSVTHRYTTPGYFTVNATITNVFTTATSTLCPTVIVDQSTTEAPPMCEKPTVTFRNLGSELTKMRSEETVIEVEPGLNCRINASANFSWKASKVTIENGEVVSEQPFPDICIFQETNDTVVFPKRSLEYGSYNITVTVAPIGMDMIYDSESFILHVIPSPPVAKFGNRQHDIAYIYGHTRMDLSGSKDPDLNTNVRLGLTYKLFCCRLNQKSNIDNKELSFLIEHSTTIKTGTLYAGSTANSLTFYDYCSCFPRHTLTSIYDGIFSFPSTAYTADTMEFYYRLFVCKEGRCSSVVQELAVRTSNDSSEYDQLGNLLTSGDTDEALQLIGQLSSALNELDDVVEDNDRFEEEAAKKRTFLINALSTVSANLSNIDQVESTANALQSVTRAKSQVTQDSRKSASSAMNNIASAVGKSSTDQPIEKVATVGQGIVGAISNLLPDYEDKTSIYIEYGQELKKRRRRSLDAIDDMDSDAEFNEDDIKCQIIVDIIGSENPAGCNEIYMELIDFFYPKKMDEFNVAMEDDVDDIFDYTLPELRAQRDIDEQNALDADREVAESGMVAINSMANVFLDKLSDNDTVSLSSSKVSVSVQKLNPKTTENVTVDTGSGSYKMPLSAIAGQNDGNSSVGAKVVNSAVNPYTYGKGSKDITGGIFTLTLTDETGNDLEVKDTDEPFEMWLPAGQTSLPELKNFNILLGEGDPPMNFHAVNILTNDTTLHIELRTTSEFDIFHVYLLYDGFPNETTHDYFDVVPRTIDSSETKYCGDNDTLTYTVFPPRNLTSRNGTYRVGVKLYEAKVKVGSGETNHTYGMRIFSSGCRYWNKTTESWRSDGCEVGVCTNYNSTQCLCNHLTSFGGNFVVPPNTIDFNTVWAKFANLHENAAVFATVISILALYILLLVWARYMDKKDIQKWGAVPLEDNLPSDTYHYQISVQTGMKKSAGTDSMISFILSGDDSDTGVRRLCDGKRKHFGRGTIRNFILSVESGLGPPTFLRIWHDNSGSGKQKGWFLDQIEVIDLQTGERHFFLCDRWLAVEEDDGLVERIIPVAGLQDLINFKHLFSSNVRKKLSNEHLWFSVFSRPTRSKFTRCQRISCCLSLLFLTMITNAMWFKTGETGDVTALKIGPFSFTLQQVFISFASTMIVFPVSFLLITIFRKCRPKRNTVSQANQRASKKSQKYRWKTVHNPPNTWGDLEKEKSKKDKFKNSMRHILNFHQRKYENDSMEAVLEAEAQQKTGKKMKKAFTLPHWMIYIAWFLVFASVTLSAFFTILYSLEWGADKANDWLMTFFMSFFQSVVVVQPIKVFLIVAFVACVLKKPEINEEEGMEEDAHVTNEEELLSKTPANINEIMLQRKMAAEELQPPDMKALEAARELRQKEMKMEVIIKEIIIYGFFVLVLFFISYQTRDSQSYVYANNLRNIFASTGMGLTGKRLSFNKISTVEDYWKWMEHVLLPQLYAEKWVNGSKLKWWDKRCIYDLESRRVGIGRLRQMRIKEDSCTIPEYMSTIMSSCRSGYDWTADDTKTYRPGWKEVADENETVIEAAMEDSPWDYQNTIELKNAPYYGKMVLYKGGGYVADFERTKSRTANLIEELKANEWLDVKTRAVFLEFTVYNPNINLFGSMTMLIEFIETGGALRKADFKVFRLFSYIGAFGTVVLIFEIVYACFTLYFLIHALRKLKKEKWKYFSSFWNILEFALLAFSVACIVMYAFKHVLASLAMSELHASGSADFVNFQSLALYDETFGYMVGCCVFLATIQFLKMLQFNRRMNMLGDTIRLATKDLKNFSIMFVIYFLAFCQLAYLLFGTSMATYDNFVASIESNFAMSLGNFDFDQMQDAQKILGPIFFFMFVGVVYIGLMSIFITIIYDSFASVKADVTLQTNEHEIVDFMWKRFKGLISVT